jgi:hypothetical protein
VVCLAPRALRDCAPSAPWGASVRPLNFTVRPRMSTAAVLDPPATHDELAAFFQSSEDYYIAKWPNTEREAPRFIGFNWGAFLVGPIWFLYRRLWKGAALCYLAEFALAATLSGPSFFACLLIFRLALGVCANSYYLRKTKKILAAVRNESLDAAPHLERLKTLGGTSETAVVIGITANVVLTLGSLVLRASQGAV